MAPSESSDYFRLGQAVIDELEEARTVEEAIGAIDSIAQAKRGPESLRAALLTLLAERAADQAVADPLGAAYEAFLMERAKAAMNADVIPDQDEQEER
jgi:hypothetical protein